MTPDFLPCLILAFYGWLSMPYRMYWVGFELMDMWRLK